MVLIWGWGNQFRKVADVGIMKCGNCNNYSTFEIRELAKNVKIYFVPVAKWGRKYYLVCNKCEGAYELEKERLDKILSEISSMPNNQTSIDIWNSIDSLLAKMIDINDTENWGDKIIPKLKAKGYEEDDIKHVLSTFIDSMIRSDNEGMEIENTKEENKELPISNNIYCPYCGVELPIKAKFCKNCGKEI